MESCLGVEREVSRVQDKISSVRNGQKKTLDGVIQAVQQVKEELLNGKSEAVLPSLILCAAMTTNLYCSQ